MLVLGCPKINFQDESSKTLDKLTNLVKQYLPEEEEHENKEDSDASHSAFQVMIILMSHHANST